MDPRDCRTKKLVCSSFSVEKFTAWGRLGIYYMADNRSAADRYHNMDSVLERCRKNLNFKYSKLYRKSLSFRQTKADKIDVRTLLLCEESMKF